jgi:hypothetical protein
MKPQDNLIARINVAPRAYVQDILAVGLILLLRA